MSPRRTFGPVVLVGLAAAGLSAVAGNQPWAEPEDYGTQMLRSNSAGEAPLAAALGLVLLACWGVLLVTRGRVRRGVAALGVLVAAGLLLTTVLGFASAPDAVRDALDEVGADAPVFRTLWFYAALVGAVLSLGATLASVKLTPHWPEMGSRYDAPGAAEPASVPPEERSSLDLWRSLDEGQDPTE